MASLIDTYTMANDATFINRISQALAQVAETVRLESDAIDEHARRHAFMLLVMNDVNNHAYKVSRMVAGNGSVAAHAPNQAAVPDNDIVFCVSELWAAFTDIYVPAAPVQEL